MPRVTASTASTGAASSTARSTLPRSTPLHRFLFTRQSIGRESRQAVHTGFVGSGPASGLSPPCCAAVPAPRPSARSDGVDLYLDRDSFREAFAADVDPGTATVMAAAQRPWSGAAAATPSGPPAWKSIPSWYLLGTEDRAIPPAGQRFMAERAKARIEEVAASHASMVSQPEVVTRLILSAVEATSR
ncbi:alpha/beta fold hydrolase [Micromonospora sp. L32]|uniref:alpha/beta fold hydrolase n=1 Tax=Micromonospora TaxID=1873 RepID=UPI003F89B1C6